MDMRKKESMMKLYKFGVWAGGVGFILAFLSSGYYLMQGQGIGLTDYLNLGVTLFAFVYFKQGLRKLKEQKD